MLHISTKRFYSTFLISSYLLLIMCGLLLPSDGGHGLLNPKSLAFLATTFFVGLHFLVTRHFNFYQIKYLSVLFYFLTFVFTWLLIGAIHADSLESPVDQFKLFLITLLFVFFTVYLVNHKVISPERILKAVIYTNFTYSFIKVSAVILHILGVINIFTLLTMMGMRFMSMDIYGQLMRMQTSVDIITPFLILFVLHSSVLNLNLNKKFRILFLIISPLSIFLSFSRYLILVGLFGYFFYWISDKLIGKIKVVFAILLLMGCAVAVIGTEPFSKVLKNRNAGNYDSDQTRVIQIQNLIQEFEYFPLLGKGMGGYATNAVRDDKIQHSYEVQWVAFLMQFGVIGISLLLMALGVIAIEFLKPPLTIIKLSFLLLFILWLLSGFTNPFLISLTSGIIYTIFFLAGILLNRPTYDLNTSSEKINTLKKDFL